MPVYNGTKAISQVYIGSQQIRKIYIGTVEVWSNSTAVTLTLNASSNAQQSSNSDIDPVNEEI